MNATEYIAARRDIMQPDESAQTAPTAEASVSGPAEIVDYDEVDPRGLGGLAEMILKQGRRLNVELRDRAIQPIVIPKLLAISLIGFTFFGVVFSFTLSAGSIWPELVPIAGWLEDPATSLISFRSLGNDANFATPWLDGSAWQLIAAYNLGLVAAIGVCLPSLYFYGLLSGVRMSMLDVVVHSLKGMATSATALVGILPIYVALCMGVLIFDAPDPLRNVVVWIGLLLPFIAGFAGKRSLYVGFSMLAQTLPEDRRAKRSCFLRRLVFSWGAVYAAVTPVMIHSLWELFSRV